MRHSYFTQPPRSVRKAQLDNVVLVPASLLAFKAEWQLIANGLPRGDVLICMPAAGPQRGILERVATDLADQRSSGDDSARGTVLMSQCITICPLPHRFGILSSIISKTFPMAVSVLDRLAKDRVAISMLTREEFLQALLTNPNYARAVSPRVCRRSLTRLLAVHIVTLFTSTVSHIDRYER